MASSVINSSSVINCRALFYKFGSSGKDYKESFNFRVKVNEDDIKDVKTFKELVRYVNGSTANRQKHPVRCVR